MLSLEEFEQQIELDKKEIAKYESFLGNDINMKQKIRDTLLENIQKEAEKFNRNKTTTPSKQ